jgi:hypothetical protein
MPEPTISFRNFWLRLALAIFLLVYAASTAQAQTPGKRWSLAFDRKDTQSVYLELSDNDAGNFSHRSLMIAVSRLNQANFKPGDTSTAAHFEITGEAGTIVCDGVVNAESGAGKYTVRNNPQFLSQLRGLGLRFEEEPDDLVSYILHDMSVGYARQMKAITDVAEAERVLKMKKLDVTPQYVQTLNTAAGQKLSGEDVIMAAKVDLRPDFIQQIRALRSDASIEEIVQLKKKDVPIDYVKAALKCRSNASLDDIVHDRKHGRSACPASY